MYLDISPGHRLRRQFLCCWDEPIHFFPPYPGGGFVQDRFRVCSPVPQDPVHCPQLDQADQPPSDEEGEIEKVREELMVIRFI